jgi:phospholipase C
LTVTAPAANTGTITSTPQGISCPGTCTYSFNQNTQVTLTAAPAANYTFGGWGGACSGMTLTCQVTVTAAASVSATFTAVVVVPPTFTVTVTTAGTGTGTVTSNTGGISCSTGSTTGCSASFAQNAQVVLTATPTTSNTFNGWTTGPCTGIGTCTITVTAATSVTASFGPSNPYAALNHIILFAQENRSLDHYFGYMRQYWANTGVLDQPFEGLPQFTPASQCTVTNGISSCAIPSVPGCQLSTDADSCTPDTTNPIQSFSFHTLQLNSGLVGTVCEENQSPFWNEAHNDWDLSDPTGSNPNDLASPALNGFAYTAAYDARSNAFMDVNGVRAMGYFQDADLNFYYALATDFATSDYWFSPVMDRTQINRAYIYAATSQGFAYPPGGGYNDSHAFTAKTIFEALQDAHLNWKVYVDTQNAVYYNPATGVSEDCSTEPAGQAQDLCLAEIAYMNEFDYETQVQNPANNLWQHFGPIVPDLQNDMQNDATFPQFALIEPPSSAGLDEHPSDADGSPVNVQSGAYYVQNSIIEPFLQSNIYQDSALIFTYDEAGGLYDHVPPQPATPPGDYLTPIDLEYKLGDICSTSTNGQALDVGICTFGWTGYRVPLVVVSPYAKQNFVSHNVRDTTAVLAMVEDRFGIPPLTNRDASYNSAQTAHVTMAEFFDFVNKPWATPPTFLPQTLYSTASGSNHCDQTPPTAWNEPPEVQVDVTGGGQVSSSPSSAIDKCTTECSGVFSTGTTVTLTATPNTGSTFTGWGGACTGTATTCTVTPTAGEVDVTATFSP